MGVGDVLVQLDEGLSSFLSTWNNYSTGIATAFVLIVTYSIVSRVDPETHPMLLARQSSGSPVRQEGESPVFRGNIAPHGLPLNSGLNVKPPGAPKWSAGRDGDLRDIWRRAAEGHPDSKAKGRILTVLGSSNVLEHKLGDITRAINLVGRHISVQGGSRVAVYLPNSVELIATLFACSFYNMTAILLPYDRPESEIISMLRSSEADAVVTAPGAFPFDAVVQSYPALRQLVWVVDEGSKHMDWNEVPKGMGGRVNVSTWQDILQDNPSDAGHVLPDSTESSDTKEIVLFWQSEPGSLEEMTAFSHGNLVSAVSAQLTAVPNKQRLSPSDLFLPAGPLTSSYTLVLTLAALYSNSSVAFNSVAGTTPDLELATIGVAPTVVVATPETLMRTHNETKGQVTSLISRAAHWFQTRSLIQHGVMPAANLISQYNYSVHPTIGTEPGKLRIIYVADSAGAGSPRLSEAMLTNLRIFTGARVVYALTAPKCAGAVAQTQVNDYRMHGDGAGSHFGPPASSTEILLKNSGSHKIEDTAIDYKGEIVVRGPAVAGGEASLGIIGLMNQDNTLSYA